MSTEYVLTAWTAGMLTLVIVLEILAIRRARAEEQARQRILARKGDRR